MVSTPSVRLRADLTLLLVAVIWGSAFVAQRVAAINAGVFLFNGLRFLIGALVLLPFARGSLHSLDGKALSGVFLAGAVLFGGTAFQQWGLRYTTAANAGFITSLYVVLIPVILALGWQRPPRRAIWVACLLAAAGLFLLSTAGRLVLNPGDVLELVGAVLLAVHVILIERLVKLIGVQTLSVGQYLVCAALSLLAGSGLENNPSILRGLVDSWITVAYTGVLSVGLGYTLQAVGQKVAPAADAAIILSGEAVFAALFGWILLGEGLTAVQLLGCGFMMAGMLLAQAREYNLPKDGNLC